MNTLTEFLLARFDDDEHIANTASGVAAGPAQLGANLWNFGDQRLEVTKRRVLAECEAKRAIVERAGGVEVGYPSHHLAQGILALLASAYADHPDYDEAWRA